MLEDLVRQIANIPALTPEGITIKAQAYDAWLRSGDEQAKDFAAKIMSPRIIGDIWRAFGGRRDMSELLSVVELVRAVEVRGTVPANCVLARAIEAHQAVREKYDAAIDDRGPEAARFALLAVLFAMTPTADDLRQQLDYLSALPLDAWAWPGRSPEKMREDWLRGISRCLTRMLSEDDGLEYANGA